MARARDPLASAAVLAGASAALHVVYAASGGITGTWTAYPLAAAAVAGAALLGLAWRREQAWLGVLGVVLGWLPIAVTWPVAMLSLAGWAVALLQLVASAMVGYSAWLAQRGAT